MHYRKLGTSESQISEVGFGAWRIAGKQSLGGTDEESLHALKRAFQLGLTFVDTALGYMDGRSERLVGQAVSQAFSQICVATKIPPKNGVSPASPETPISEVYPYEHIMECTHQSLRNLGVKQIFLQQFEVWTDAWTNTDEWRRAVEDLRSTGKVRFMGLCVTEHDPDSALEAIKTDMFQSVQAVYNIFDQGAAENLFPLCHERRVGVLARAPLDEGSLTGEITPDSVFEPGDFLEQYLRGDRKQQVFDRVTALKRDLEGLMTGTLAETALAFCLSNHDVTSVLPGMRSVANVESNSRVSSAGALHPQVLEILKRHEWKRNFYQ